MHWVPCNYRATLSYAFLHTALRPSTQILHLWMLQSLSQHNPPQLWQVERDWKTHCFCWVQFSRKTLCCSSEDELGWKYPKGQVVLPDSVWSGKE